MSIEDSLRENGYATIAFAEVKPIDDIQKIVSQIFPCPPIELHKKPIDDNTRLALVKEAKDAIVKSGYVKQLLYDNAKLFMTLLGPDIDIQSDIYLRVSRPSLESDFIDWHRDTFYGNSYWELNFWVPIFPLSEGAGLMVVKGSHLTPSHNVQAVNDQNAFRSTVTKGSLANELGYLYAPKRDDTISNLDTSQITLLSPPCGQGILFFTHAAHRAHNASNETRISMDLRIRSMLAPTNTKPGYYQPLTRGVIASCVEKMMAMSN